MMIHRPADLRRNSFLQASAWPIHQIATKDSLNKPRVAASLALECFSQIRSRRSVDELLNEFRGLGTGKGTQGKMTAFFRREGSPVGQSRQRHAHFWFPVADDYQCPHVTKLACRETEQGQGQLVDGLQVVEYQNQRPTARQAPEGRCDPIENAKALHIRVPIGAGQCFYNLSHFASQILAPRRQIGTTDLNPGPAHGCAQPRASAPQRDRAASACAYDKLACQSRLAYPGLTRERADFSSARKRISERRSELIELFTSAD